MAKHTKESLLSQLRDFHAKHGRVPAWHNWQSETRDEIPNVRLYVYYFGSWDSAVAAAGFPTRLDRNREKAEQICKNCGNTFHNKRGSKKTFCNSSCAAKYNNTHKTHGTRRSKLETYIEKRLLEDFPEISFEFNSKSAIESELDVYCASLGIAVELSGILHYEPIYGEVKLESIRDMDKLKAVKCLEKGIKLHVIDTSKHGYVTPATCEPYYLVVKSIVEGV